MRYILIGICGLAGVFARYFCGVVFLKLSAHPIPLGTFVINIVGSFGIGLVYSLGNYKDILSQDIRAGIMVGFLGGFTTFSSFCLEAVGFLEAERWGMCMLYLFGSPAVGVGAVLLGMTLARKFAECHL